MESPQSRVARLRHIWPEGEVTLKRLFGVDEGRIERRPENSNPEHHPIEVDLKKDAFEVCCVAVGGLIQDGFNQPTCELESA